MRYVLGIDGGGSKIVCLAANEEGTLLGYGRGGAANTNYVLYQEAKDSAIQAISSALNDAGLRGGQIDALVLSAPIDPTTLNEVVKKCNIRNLVRAAEGETSRWAARFWIDEHIGVTVDAGTGSLSRGWTRDGRETGAGGFGATVGDEGSGVWISIKAIRAVLQAYDGRLEPTRLTEPVLNYFGLSHPHELPFLMMGGFISSEKVIENKEARERLRFTIDSGHILEETTQKLGKDDRQEAEATGGGLFFRKFKNAEPLARHEVASLCTVVGDVALEGDRIAIQILKDAGTELARLARAVIRRLGMQDDHFAIVPFGGVFRIGDPVLKPFHELCLKEAPRARIISPKFEPEVGAVILALNRIGVVIDDSILNTIERSSYNFPMCRRDGGLNNG